MSIEHLLTEHTTLPIDIIKYCIQPYLRRPRQWENTFAHVLDEVYTIGFWCGGERNITRKDIKWMSTFRDKRLLGEVHQRVQIAKFGNIEY